jgi:hypothetical protein
MVEQEMSSRNKTRLQRQDITSQDMISHTKTKVVMVKHGNDIMEHDQKQDMTP